MKDIEIVVQELSSRKVLSFLGYGEQPEELAWEKTNEFLETHAEEIKNAHIRIFGFNNPCPSAGSSKYGYEFWISGLNGIEFRDTEELVRKEFSGGLYATALLKDKNVEEIPSWWGAMNAWCETSPYTMAQHQWLEEHSLEGQPFSIWLPIKK